MVTVEIQFAQGSARVAFASLQELLKAQEILKKARDGGRGIVDIAMTQPNDVQFERGKIFVSCDCIARATVAKYNLVHILVIAKMGIEHSIESNKTAKA